jgi:hypothetical protein
LLPSRKSVFLFVQTDSVASEARLCTREGV